jgi:hypothetical protein
MKKTLAVAVGLFCAANCYAWNLGGFNEGELRLQKNDIYFSELDTDPVAPETNGMKMYAKDNGSGGTKIYTMNSSGTVTEIGAGAGSDFATDFGTESFADDQVFVADDVNGGTPRTVPDTTAANTALSYDQSTNTFSAKLITGSNGWADAGTEINLSTSTDAVGIGGSALGKLSVTGTSDQAQFVVRGNATQTASLAIFEQSDGTDVLTISNAGVMTLTGSGSATNQIGTITLADDTDGALTITANGDGSDEDLTLNLDDTANTAVISSSTGVTGISLTSIGITTGAASNLSAGTTTLGTVAGAIDAGGATSVEIPNGTGPTVDAAGEVAVDTTDDQLVYYGAAKRVIPYTQDKCFTVQSPDGTTHDNVPFWSPTDAITITGVYCRTQGGTSVGITISDGTNALEEVVCDSDGQADDGSITNGTFTANERMEFDTGTETGTVDFCNVCVRYTVDAQ